MSALVSQPLYHLAEYSYKYRQDLLWKNKTILRWNRSHSHWTMEDTGICTALTRLDAVKERENEISPPCRWHRLQAHGRCIASELLSAVS